MARNFITISPFMLFKVNKAILEYNRDSTQVLLATIAVFEEFGKSTNMNEDLNFEKTTESCKDIALWLFRALKGNSTQTVGCSNRMWGSTSNQLKHH